MNNRHYLLSGSLIFIGVMGVLVSLLGEFSSLGDYKSAEPRSWERFDQMLANETPDFLSLQKKLDLLINQSTNQPTTEQEKMLIIYELVINRFTHSDQARYNLFSNWFLWLMGEAYSPFSYIRNPDVLVGKGYSALCSEQAYLLQTLAETEGVRTRSVGLNGHVVMEAWYENNWHLFDPDLEVVPRLENQRILSLDELAKSPELIRKYYAARGNNEYIEQIVDIVATREDNSFVSHPRLALFEWKTNVLFHFEKIANIIKYFFPMMFLVIGSGLYFRKSSEN